MARFTHVVWFAVALVVASVGDAHADLPDREAGSTMGSGGVAIIPTHAPDDDGGGGPLRPFLVGGGALAVGAIILIAVLVAGSSSNTALTPPMVQP